MKRIKCFFSLIRIYSTYLFRKIHCNCPPVRLWIELSSRCNLKCRLCVNKDIPQHLKGDIDFDLYKKIIDEVKDYAYDVNLFHRGEPLLHPRLIDIISYARASNIKTRIHTNSTLLTPALSRKIILSGLDLISFSFDGYTKETYEKNRAGASYEKSLNNIITFLKIKKELNSTKPFIIVQVMEFDEELTSKNFEEQKKKFIINFNNLPLDKLIVRTPHNWGGLLKLNGIKKVSHKGTKLIPCTFPWYSLTIFYDGKVYLCPQDFDGKILIGDVNKNPISEIFNNQAIKEVRKKFKTGKIKEFSPCKDCDRIWRKTFMGVPKEYLGIFIKDSLRK